MAPSPQLPTALSSPVIIGGNYRLIRKIGSGSFGEVYLGVHMHNGQQVAVKLEKKESRFLQLAYESRLYRILRGKSNECRTIPRYWGYCEESKHNALIMELMGPSLEQLFVQCSRRFSLKTGLMLADQMIGCIEYIHSKNFVHRDIKPDNFVMGIGKNANRLYLIDFGLAKRFVDVRTGNHIPYRDDKRMTGTARYASLKSHLGVEQSRRDDLESIGYVLLYLVKGSLPWQGTEASTKKKKYEKIKEAKVSTSIEALCSGYPVEFVHYLGYCRSLGFNSTPDYMILRRSFRILFRTLNYQYDHSFDWNILYPNTSSMVTNVIAKPQ